MLVVLQLIFKLLRITKIQISSIFSGEMRQGIPVYTPSWISPLGDQTTEEYDWGLITATPTQQSEDWGNQYKRRDNTEGSRELGILTSSVQLRSDWWSTLSKPCHISSGETVLFRIGFTGTATFLLSEDLSIAAAISYESSGITGIATYKGAFNFSGANWFSQAVQHTVFGEEGEISNHWYW